MTQAQSGAAIVKKDQPVEVKIRDGRLDPQTLDEAWRVSLALVRGNAIPGGCNSTEEVLIAVLAGMDVGLSPLQAVQNIMVVRKRPTIWGDAMLGLVEQSGKLDDIEETMAGSGDAREAVCRVVKRGRKTPIVRSFSVAQAKMAGLWGKDTWKNYPDRMLQLRARSFALRDSFPEVLKGLHTTEEMQDAASEAELRKSASASAVLASLPESGVPLDVPAGHEPEAVDAEFVEPNIEDVAGPDPEPVVKSDPWGDVPKRNAAQHPAYWRAKLIESAEDWLAKQKDIPPLVSGRSLLVTMDSAEGSPPPEVPHSESTPWFKKWADKAAAGEIDWRKYL